MADDAPIVVIGAGGHARVMAEAVRLSGMAIAGHIAPEPGDTRCLGPYLGQDDVIAALVRAGHVLALGIGFADQSGAARRDALLGRLGDARLLRVTHPNAIISPSATLDEGAFLAAGSVVGTGTRIGRAAIVNTGAVVDHDAVVGANSHIATGARVAGGVRIGAGSLIGAGAVLRQGLVIGNRVVVGAGAVVIGPVEDDQTVVGNPARKIGARA